VRKQCGPDRAALTPCPSFVRPCIRFAIYGLLLVFAFALAAAGQQQQIITEIRIHGNRRIPTETIKARIFTRPGDIYDKAAIERDFNSLWNTSYFEDLRFETEQTPKGLILHIYVKERPTIREIHYTGISSVSTSDILDRFKQEKVGLSPESQYDPTKVKKAEVVIKELLAERGRQFATVRTEVRSIPPESVAVTFVVKEGPKVKVGKIRFEGNKHVSSRDLVRSMKGLRPIGIPYSIFLEDIFAKTYDASKLDDDTERVREEYQNRGYFKVIVQDAQTKIHDTGHTGFHIPLLMPGPGKAVDITIPIEEGDRYRLGGITFKHIKALNNTKALRGLFPIKDGDIFDREKIAKGLENLRKAYGEYGYINFTSIPDTSFDEAKKLVYLNVDVDEGKQFYVRRIEFVGNTTTRDKVIRREILLQEGQVYNQRLWEISLQRLNQLGYFQQLKPDDPDTTERHLNEQEGTVDLTLKVKEKGKNSIGLTGGVSGLSGSFIGMNYSTNNFLGLGETLSVSADIGNLERDITFGFTQPYFLDRPYQLGFTVYGRKYNYNEAQQEAILSGLQLNLPQAELNNLQNYTQSSSGFTVSLSHALSRSFDRVGISYSFDNSSLVALSTASKNLFTYLQFQGISGPNSLNGIITSQIFPTFSFNKLDSAYFPHKGSEFTTGVQIAGLGGTVNSVRPIIEFQHWIPVQKGRNTVGFRLQGSFLTGYGGIVAPPFERFYMGGENDIRGFDIRSISPVAYITTIGSIALTNPDGSVVPKNPANPLQGAYTIPIPVEQVTFPGGDGSFVANAEYRITLFGQSSIGPFMDFGLDPIVRPSQLRITNQQFSTIENTQFGCPQLDVGLNCTGTQTINQILKQSQLPGFSDTFSPYLFVAPGTSWVPRMSTGLEFKIMLPVVNAPFRIYWAYNLLRLDTTSSSPVPIARSMFPAGAAGDYTYRLAIANYAPTFMLREPRKTFRFTVATTF
jgi:outer membrane protein insertion porin family